MVYLFVYVYLIIIYYIYFRGVGVEIKNGNIVINIKYMNILFFGYNN